MTAEGSPPLPWHYWKGRPVEERREHLRQLAWDNMVASWIRIGKTDPQSARYVLGELAAAMRENLLPESGRRYVAEVLEALAKGEMPAELLPDKNKRKGYTSDQILGAVEREKIRLGQDRADRFIYDKVGREFGIKWTTAAKETSMALKGARWHVRTMMELGTDEDWVTGFWAHRLSLSSDTITGLLFDPLFEK